MHKAGTDSMVVGGLLFFRDTVPALEQDCCGGTGCFFSSHCPQGTSTYPCWNGFSKDDLSQSMSGWISFHTRPHLLAENNKNVIVLDVPLFLGFQILVRIDQNPMAITLFYLLLLKVELMRNFVCFLIQIFLWLYDTILFDVIMSSYS